jgi:hypothetical protein
VALTAETYDAWAATGHAPEETFLAALNSIDGITQVETQTFTVMPL